VPTVERGLWLIRSLIDADGGDKPLINQLAVWSAYLPSRAIRSIAGRPLYRMSIPRVDLPEPKPGEHDDLVLGDVQADVFQIVQAGAADADVVWHGKQSYNKPLLRAPGSFAAAVDLQLGEDIAQMALDGMQADG
jgi:hypothetical protein